MILLRYSAGKQVVYHGSIPNFASGQDSAEEVRVVDAVIIDGMVLPAFRKPHGLPANDTSYCACLKDMYCL